MTLIVIAPDCQFRQITCKHANTVKYYLEIVKETSKGKESTKIPLNYSQS